jgi:imidazolonepropionase-like amidohydrolase
VRAKTEVIILNGRRSEVDTMGRFVGLALSFLLLLSGFSQSAAHTQEAQRTGLVFTHVTVIDATGADAKPDMTVVITGDRITELGRSDRVRAPKGAKVVDATGKFMIPGLWDMHVHLQEAGKLALPVFIANGITSVRDMGTAMSIINACRDAIRKGEVDGPRIKAAGYMITSPRVWDLLTKSLGEEAMKKEATRRISVGNPEEAHKAVAEIARSGADFVKLHWIADKQTYFALADEARRRGLMLVGHDPLQGITLQEISDAGQKSIEHYDGSFASQLKKMDKKAREDLYARFIRNGTSFVPTLLLMDIGPKLNPLADADARLKYALDDSRGRYISDQLAYGWRGFLKVVPKFPGPELYFAAVLSLREINQAGVRIMAGTDLGVPLVYPGFSLHTELEQLVRRVAMTPMQAIQAATLRPAEFFGMQQKLGTIERGKVADLVLLEANPLDDIKNTQKVDSVVVGGRLLTKAHLQKDLAEVEAEASKSRR